MNNIKNFSKNFLNFSLHSKNISVSKPIILTVLEFVRWKKKRNRNNYFNYQNYIRETTFHMQLYKIQLYKKHLNFVPSSFETCFWKTLRFSTRIYSIFHKHTAYPIHFSLDALVKFILTVILSAPQSTINIYHSRRTNRPIKSWMPHPRGTQYGTVRKLLRARIV